MNKSRLLLSLVLCLALAEACVLSTGCLGKPSAAPTPDATAEERPPPTRADPTLTQEAPPAAATATPTSAADADGEIPTPTTETEEVAPPAAPAKGAGGRLGYDDGYVTFAEVAEQAAFLGYDLERLFDFVRDEIAFESYSGVLRGPRGVLWGGAGNATDQSALLYALLRESGIEARFARGVLDANDARRLLQTMFTPALESRLSDVESSGGIADPLNDAALLAEATDHIWVQARGAEGWIDLDPTFAETEMGQRHAEPTATYNRLPDEFYHRLSVRVCLERITSRGLELSYPLVYTGRVADLVGRRIEFRHILEEMGSQGGMEAVEIGRVLGARQRRYRPVLRIDEEGEVGELFAEAEGLDLDAPVGRMAQALGDQSEEAGPLSGEWIEFTLTGPDGAQEIVERAVFDRLGPSARAAQDLERLVRLDMSELLLTTHLSVAVLPCRVPADVAQARIDALMQPLVTEHENLSQQLEARRAEGIESETRKFVANSLLPYDVRLWAGLAHLTNEAMASASDDVIDRVAEPLAVKAYYDSARIVITSLSTQQDGTPALSVDLRRDAIRALAYPGGDRAVEIAFRLLRGMLDGALEGQVLQWIVGAPALCAVDVFAQAQASGIEWTFVTADHRARLDDLALLKDARARIEQALDKGYGCVVPGRFVSFDDIDGEPRSAWWRIDLSTGAAVGVMDSGLHQGMIDWGNVITNLYIGQVTGAFDVSTEPIDVLIGYDSTLINFAGNVLEALDTTTLWSEIKTQASSKLMGQARSTIMEIIASGGGAASTQTFLIGAGFAVNLIDNTTSFAEGG